MKEWNNISLSLNILHLFLPFESIVIHLFLYRQKIIAKNEEIYEERLGKSTSVTVYEDDSNTLEDSSNKRQELWTEKLFSIIRDGRNNVSVSLENSCEVFLGNAYDEFSSWVVFILFLSFHNLLSSEWLGMFEFSSQLHRFAWLFIEKWCCLYLELSFLWPLYYFSLLP